MSVVEALLCDVHKTKPIEPQAKLDPVSGKGPTMTTKLIGLQVKKYLVSGEGPSV